MLPFFCCLFVSSCFCFLTRSLLPFILFFFFFSLVCLCSFFGGATIRSCRHRTLTTTCKPISCAARTSSFSFISFFIDVLLWILLFFLLHSLLSAHIHTTSLITKTTRVSLIPLFFGYLTLSVFLACHYFLFFFFVCVCDPPLTFYSKLTCATEASDFFSIICLFFFSSSSFLELSTSRRRFFTSSIKAI